MRALTPQQIVDLWTECAAAHPIDRTLAMIARALPADEASTLPDVPIGTRERLALELRIKTFGEKWEGTASCPECGEVHELEPPIDAIMSQPLATQEAVLTRVEGYEVRLRVPNSRDQAEVIAAGRAEQGVRRMLERCLLEVAGREGPLEVSALCDEVVALTGEAVAKLDPSAESLLDLTCVDCSANWRVVFDVGEFLWSEVSAHARRLLRQVHVLARAYGWREADILGMNPRRREAYIEQLGAA